MQSTKTPVDVHAVYLPSEELVTREIEGELIIVPLRAGIGDMEEDLYSLSKTAMAVWKKLNGKRRLADIIKQLSSLYKTPVAEIEKDVCGFLTELLKRKLIVKVSR